MVFTSHANLNFINANFPPNSLSSAVSELSDFRKEKAKQKCRNGLPIRAKTRIELYKNLILRDQRPSGENEDLVNGANDEEIESSLNASPTFGKKLFRFPWLSDSGILQRNRILKRIKSDFPNLTRTPLLQLILSVFLVYIESVEEVYKLISAFISQAECPIAKSENQALADDNTLRDLAMLKLKSEKIKNWMSVSQIANSKWRFWIFLLPFPLITSFVDCLILEGPKIKFRFALGFLLLLKNLSAFGENFSLMDEEEIEDAINNEKFESTKLLQKAFGIKRLSWQTCLTLISRHKVLLDLKSDGLGGAVSRLTQVNAGEYFDQARNAGSEITDVGDLARLISILPPRFTVQQMQKIMTTKKDGYSLRSVAHKVREKSDILILIKPSKGEELLIGAFLSGIDTVTNEITGNGESFVFRIESEVESWFWTESCPSLFAKFDKDHWLIGNGSISIDSDLKHCSTDRSEVFSNPNLISKDDSFQTFEILHLECFCFSDIDLS